MNDKSLATIFPPPKMIPESLRLEASIEQRRYLCAGFLARWSGPVQDVWSPIYLPTLNAAAPDSITKAGGSGLGIAYDKKAKPGNAEPGNAELKNVEPRNTEPGNAGLLLQPRRLGSYPLLGQAETETILAAACRAYDHGRGPWPTMPEAERIAIVEQFLERMRECRTQVVKLLLWEIGKSLAEAEMEFTRTIEYIAATIAVLRDWRRRDAVIIREQGFLGRFRRAPLGVVLCLGPFNNPFYETYTTMIPALLMGNTVIFKPPRLGVLLHQPLLPVFQEIFPPGVVGSLYGEGETVLAPLMKSGRIDALAFTGSRSVADKLRRWHPHPRRLRCLLGLEAKNAAIVLADADQDQAVNACVLGALAFNGQRCTALKILFIHESIIDFFLVKLCRAVAQQTWGMPWLPGVRITPLAEPARITYLNELLADARAQGARILNDGGGAVYQTLMTPAVLYPVGKGMRIYHEEQFGPIIPVASFAGLEKPVGYLEQADFGQQVSIFGKNGKEIAGLARSLANQVCRININSKSQRSPDSFPFTGRKNSAEGTMSVSTTLETFSISTLLVSQDNPGDHQLLADIVT